MRSIVTRFSGLGLLCTASTAVLLASLSGVGCSSSTTSTSDDAGAVDSGTDGPSADGGGCVESGSGSLEIVVTGLPAGVTAKVNVVGPGDPGTKDAPGALTLGGGQYDVVGLDVTAPDPTVRTVYTASVDAQVCVKDGQKASVTVAYTAIPTSNKLWTGTANATHDLLAYSSSHLQATGSPAADLADDVDRPGGLAFDRQGGLWAVHGSAGAGAQEIAYYKPSTLAASGQKTPDRILSGDALNEGVPGIHGIALDATGNLWVTAPAANKVLRFDAHDIEATGTPTPKVTITGVTGASGLAFDGAGNLWVSSATDSKVEEFVATRLNASTSDPADRLLTAQTPQPTVSTLAAPGALAFDADKNLWVVYNGSTLGRLSEAERAGTGDATITPAVQVALDVTSLAEGIAFDEGGGLWLGYQSGKLAHIAKTALATSGQPTPDRILSTDDFKDSGEMALYPAPAGLPLFDALP